MSENTAFAFFSNFFLHRDTYKFHPFQLSLPKKAVTYNYTNARDNNTLHVAFESRYCIRACFTDGVLLGSAAYNIHKANIKKFDTENRHERRVQ